MNLLQTNWVNFSIIWRLIYLFMYELQITTISIIWIFFGENLWIFLKKLFQSYIYWKNWFKNIDWTTNGISSFLFAPFIKLMDHIVSARHYRIKAFYVVHLVPHRQRKFSRGAGSNIHLFPTPRQRVWGKILPIPVFQDERDILLVIYEIKLKNATGM